jgi:hypothetical protein
MRHDSGGWGTGFGSFQEVGLIHGIGPTKPARHTKFDREEPKKIGLTKGKNVREPRASKI